MLKYQKKNQQIKGKNLVSQRLYAKEQKINSIIKSKRISDEKKPNVENKLGELSRKTKIHFIGLAHLAHKSI